MAFNKISENESAELRRFIYTTTWKVFQKYLFDQAKKYRQAALTTAVTADNFPQIRDAQTRVHLIHDTLVDTYTAAGIQIPDDIKALLG